MKWQCTLQTRRFVLSTFAAPLKGFGAGMVAGSHKRKADFGGQPPHQRQYVKPPTQLLAEELAELRALSVSREALEMEVAFMTERMAVEVTHRADAVAKQGAELRSVVSCWSLARQDARASS